MRNEIWNLLKDAVAGDAVTLVLRPQSRDGGEDILVQGTIKKVTPASRVFTIEGAFQDGHVKLSARQFSETHERGYAQIDGKRYSFSIATAHEIAWISNPNLSLWERFYDAQRNLRRHSYGNTILPARKVEESVADLEAALAAARAVLAVAE